MADTTTPAAPGGSVITPKAPKGRRSDYDQTLANDITATAEMIQAALSDAAVLAALSYSEEELREGLALQEAAQKAFDARQNAQGAASAKRLARDTLLKKVMDEFTAFRTTVQNSFPPAARTPLGAGGVVPTDLQKRITLMRGAYTTAQTPDFAPTLAKRKLTAAVLMARLAEVDELEKLSREFRAADKSATAATQARDEAGEAMRKWTGKLRKQAKSDLRGQPELRAKLGL